MDVVEGLLIVQPLDNVHAFHEVNSMKCNTSTIRSTTLIRVSGMLSLFQGGEKSVRQAKTLVHVYRTLVVHMVWNSSSHQVTHELLVQGLSGNVEESGP